MKIFITLDYEIYFGPDHGTVDQCIIEPTEALARIAARHGVSLVFFVDCGFLLKLMANRDQYPELATDYSKITDQLKRLSQAGHDLQLHIHPHWEDSYYDGNRWVINLSRYKLVDFGDDEIAPIVHRYKSMLEGIAANPVSVYRAGGWCLQPFTKIKNALVTNGIVADCSVFRNGYYQSAQYDYDFRSAPDKAKYRFRDDPATENDHGTLTEYPIASIRNSPIFYWRLFLLGRLNPYLHKPLGDGRAMPAPGQRFQMLTRYTHQCVSIDGYNAKLLPRALRLATRKGFSHWTVIGHPKALSRYSLSSLDQFLGKAVHEHRFLTFTQELTP